MAYTWKAAQLLGNPYNPGYSTSTACGIPCAGQRATVGTSDKAMAIMHPEVRFVLIDEISFVSQKHLGVSGPPTLLKPSYASNIVVTEFLHPLHASHTLVGN
jgi:hypothetical protein